MKRTEIILHQRKIQRFFNSGKTVHQRILCYLLNFYRIGRISSQEISSGGKRISLVIFEYGFQVQQFGRHGIAHTSIHFTQ